MNLRWSVQMRNTNEICKETGYTKMPNIRKELFFGESQLKE